MKTNGGTQSCVYTMRVYVQKELPKNLGRIAPFMFTLLSVCKKKVQAELLSIRCRECKWDLHFTRFVANTIKRNAIRVRPTER